MLNDIIRQNIKNILPKPMLEALVSLKYYRNKVPNFDVYINHIVGKKGIEIGGPSTIFKAALPLYRKVQSLDGVNFSNATVWEGKIKSGLNYNFVGYRRGVQFISDATDLFEVEDCAYDFLLSSNCLEHIANPIRALMEWKRVLRDKGSLILVLPSKASNFDHQRATTAFDHLVEDFINNTTEYDLTHLDEILKLHDLSMDPQAGNIEDFQRRSLDNFNNRTLHHHVFDLNTMASMLEYCGFDIIQRSETNTNFVMLAIKKI